MEADEIIAVLDFIKNWITKAQLPDRLTKLQQLLGQLSGSNPTQLQPPTTQEMRTARDQLVEIFLSLNLPPAWTPEQRNLFVSLGGAAHIGAGGAGGLRKIFDEMFGNPSLISGLVVEQRNAINLLYNRCEWMLKGLEPHRRKPAAAEPGLTPITLVFRHGVEVKTLDGLERVAADWGSTFRALGRAFDAVPASPEIVAATKHSPLALVLLIGPAALGLLQAYKTIGDIRLNRLQRKLARRQLGEENEPTALEREKEMRAGEAAGLERAMRRFALAQKPPGNPTEVENGFADVGRKMLEFVEKGGQITLSMAPKEDVGDLRRQIDELNLQIKTLESAKPVSGLLPAAAAAGGDPDPDPEKK